jgi:hypothetical protein
VGAVVYQMATYLGSFPFPSLAPTILTMEAMLKVLVIMTERYTKVLHRGKADRQKLLFRSLAVFERRSSASDEKPGAEILAAARDENIVGHAAPTVESPGTAPGFSVDQPGSDGEDEDDDELALAALESLDAIEVFKHDRRADTKIHHARIPSHNFQSKIAQPEEPCGEKVDHF